MVIAVASGKGGTGKTLVSTSLALSLPKPLQFLDMDVEEPNAGIFLKPKIRKKEPVLLPFPVVDEKKCTYCGKCGRVCQFNSIAVVKKKVLIFYELCHSCGACVLACPERSIFEIKREKGVIEEGKRDGIEFFRGELRIGEASPTFLVKRLKKKVKKNYTVIMDCSPGVSCPVVEAIKDSDFALLVTEPTPFGLSDLGLAVEVCRKFGVKCGVIVNRAHREDERVKKYLEREEIPLLMAIPLKREIAEAYSKGNSLVEVLPEYREKFQNLFEKIKKLVQNA